MSSGLTQFFFSFLSLYWICYNIASVLCFVFFHGEACRILAPWLGIEPPHPGIERWNLIHWTFMEICNLTQLWHSLPGSSITSRRLTAQSHQTVPSSPLPVPTPSPCCHLCFWPTDYRSEVPAPLLGFDQFPVELKTFYSQKGQRELLHEARCGVGAEIPHPVWAHTLSLPAPAPQPGSSLNAILLGFYGRHQNGWWNRSH